MSIFGDIGDALGVTKDDPDKQAADALGLSPEQYRRKKAMEAEKEANELRYQKLAHNENYDRRQRQLEEERRKAEQRQAPQSEAARVGPITTVDSAQIDRSEVGGPSSFRGNSEAYVKSLEDAAKGIGPSIAQMQYQRATDTNLRNLMAAQAAVRGQGAGSALRNLREAQAQVQQDAALQSGQLRAQEQLAARAQLGAAIGTGLQYDTGYRGQQIGLATSQAELEQQARLANQGYLNQAQFANAGYQQQSNLANQQSEMNLLGLNQQANQWTTGQELGLDQQQIAARMAAAQMAQQEQMQQNQIIAGAQQQANAGGVTDKDVFGVVAGGGAGLVGGIGSALAMSSKETKTDVKELEERQASSFLEALGDMNSSEVPKDMQTQKLPAAAGVPNPFYLANLVRYGGNQAKADLMSNPSLSTVGGSSIGTGQRDAMVNRIAGGGTRPGGFLGGPILSDERKKTNVQSVGQASQFMKKLEPKSFEYKDQEAHGKGRRIGFMAQDLEDAGPVGRAMVVNTPQGKMVNYAQGIPVMMANDVEQNKRIEELEKKLREKKKK